MDSPQRAKTGGDGAWGNDSLGCLGRCLGRSCACACAWAAGKSRFRDRSEFHDRVWCFAATSQAAGKSAGGRATAIRRNGTSWVGMSPSTSKSPSHSAIWLGWPAAMGRWDGAVSDWRKNGGVEPSAQSALAVCGRWASQKKF